MDTSENQRVSLAIGKAGFTPRKGEVAKVAAEIRRLGLPIDEGTVREAATRLGVRDNATMQAEHKANTGLDDDEAEAGPKGLDALAAALEALHEDVVVIDGQDMGHGYYALKLQTPVGVYLSEGTAAGWMAQARADVRAASEFACPFCGAGLAWEPGKAGGSCPSCRACHDRDAGRLAVACGLSAAPADVAVAALADIHGTFRADEAHNVFWARPASAIEGHPLGKALEGVEGPSMADGTVEVALLADNDMATADVMAAAMAAPGWREARDAGEGHGECGYSAKHPWAMEGWLRTGTCRECVHGLVTHDRSDCIEGVYSFGHSRDSTHCVRPLDARKYLDELRGLLSPEPTRARGYRTNDIGIFGNAVIDAAMAGLFQVDDKGDGLEGRAPDELGGYVGPLCPGFVLDPDALCDRGDLRHLPATIPVVFGEPDGGRIAREEAAARLRLDWTAARDILLALRTDGEAGPVLRAKVQMSGINGPGADRLVDLLERHLPDTVLERGPCTHFRGFAVEVSATAATALDARLRDRARTRSGNTA